jgi:hypothetical protein
MTQKRAHACEKLGIGDRHLEPVGGAASSGQTIDRTVAADRRILSA